MNIAKLDKPPIVLKLFGDFANEARKWIPAARRGEAKAIKRLEELRKELVEDTRLLTQVVRKTPYLKTSRLRLNVRKEVLEYMEEEWRTGKPHLDKLTTRPQPEIKHRPCPELPPWLKTRIDQIERWAGHKLPRSEIDGCPYPFHEDTMPPDWCWARFVSLMEVRFDRMKKCCNKGFPTSDTVWTILIECILQACVVGMSVCDTTPDKDRKRAMQERYGNFLYLPLTLDPRNLLTFAFAKIHHHEAMWSRWKESERRPGEKWGDSISTLEDRIQADPKNNLLVEPQFTNLLKCDFSNELIPVLLELVLEIKVPKEVADPDRPMSEYDAAIEKEMKQAASAASSDGKKSRDAQKKAEGARGAKEAKEARENGSDILGAPNEEEEDDDEGWEEYGGEEDDNVLYH